MKHFLKKLMVTAMSAMILMGLTAGCGSTDSSEEKYVISFYNADKLLGTVEIASGQVMDASAYEVYAAQEGFELTGWYGTKTFIDASLVDLGAATFTEDTNLYGKFKSTDLKEDIRKWYIVGESDRGSIKVTKFGGSVDDSIKEGFLLTSTGDGSNTFVITLDLFAEDAFQVIPEWSFDEQRGFGYVKEYDAADAESGYSQSGDDKKANIKVLRDGNYTVSITTDPENGAMDEIKIVRNSDTLTNPEIAEEKPAEEAIPFTCTDTTEVKIKGSWVSDWSEFRELSREEGTNVFTITTNLDADTQFGAEIFDQGEDAGIFMASDAVKDETSKSLLNTAEKNITIASAGSYTITVDLDAMTITISEAALGE